MIKAPIPKDEIERLAALYEYEILDTEAEKVFDDLTLMASQICNTPIALISLVDPNRQWFKSHIGINATETSRDIAFCAHAIHQNDVFEVSDTLADQRFYDNPLVIGDPKIRFYAGAQLVTPSGHAIGTLCAIDQKPQKLTKQQRSSLQILSREVISQLELRCKIKQLESVSLNKSEFLANISHELRTPLNAVVNFSQLLSVELSQQHNQNKLNEYADYLNSASKHLLNLVNSLLDLSKIEQGKMELDLNTTQSHPLFERLYGVISIQAKNKSIKFKQFIHDTVPDCLTADEAKLRQIYLNLVGNAIKFTPENGIVNIDLDWNADQLVFTIEDNGYGIDQADQHKLFKKFEQVNRRSNVEGSGLGLAITKGLVELMQGTIHLESALGIGTKITVKLPLVTSTANTDCKIHEKETLRCDLQSKILLVEDTLINQQVATAIFKILGLSFDLAKSGEQSLEMVEKSDYNLVFMDLHLPGINGQQAAKAIQRIKPKLPIVALTADVFRHDSVDAKDSALSEYLTKPLEIEKLIRVLNRFLPKRTD